MQNDKICARKGGIKIRRRTKVKMCKLGNYSLIRILYWIGSGLELLSTCLITEVLQSFLTRKEPSLLDTKHATVYNSAMHLIAIL